MDVALVVIVALAVILTPILLFKYGVSTSLLGLVLLTLALVPRRVLSLGPLDPGHAGLTTSSVIISTYTIAIVVGAIYLAGHRLIRIPIPFVIFALITLVLMEPAWGGTSAQFAGWVHIVIAMIAWGVGYGFSQRLELDGKTSTAWAQIITVILFAQLVIVGITMLGISLPSFVTLTDNVGERALGTLGNAAILSKMTFLVLIILLPLTSSALKATRRWAGVGVAFSLILTGLTVSRANMVAVAALVGIWALLVPGRVSTQVRLLMIFLGAVAVYFFAGPFIERMDTDAAGTLRPALLDAAYRQIDSSPWIGVGINSYVENVGQFDMTTALGFPVHNTFLLMTAEVGIPLAILFFLPFVGLVWKAFKNFRTPGASGAFAWAILGSVVGLLAITLTGWGMLSSFSLSLWTFVFGVAAAQISRKAHDGDRVLLTVKERRERVLASA